MKKSTRISYEQFKKNNPDVVLCDVDYFSLPGNSPPTVEQLDPLFDAINVRLYALEARELNKEKERESWSESRRRIHRKVMEKLDWGLRHVLRLGESQ